MICNTVVKVRSAPEIGPYQPETEKLPTYIFEVQIYITRCFFKIGPEAPSKVRPTSHRKFFFPQTRELLFLRGNSCKVVSFRQEVNGTRRCPLPLLLYRSPLEKTRREILWSNRIGGERGKPVYT